LEFRIKAALQKSLALGAQAEKLTLAVAQDLREIRDQKLYRPHQNFGEYVAEALPICRQRAYQLINWAVVSTVVDTELPNEGVSRDLALLPLDTQKEIAARAKQESGLRRPPAETFRRLMAEARSEEEKEAAKTAAPRGARRAARPILDRCLDVLARFDRLKLRLEDEDILRAADALLARAEELLASEQPRIAEKLTEPRRNLAELLAYAARRQPG
jgi:hypothetical protein